MKFIYTLAFAICTQLSFSQQVSEKLKGLDSRINELITQYKAVGLSVAIVKDDKVIYSKGFGYRDLSNKLPVTENTIFPIGSITKSFTGSILGILESQNHLSLKDKPADHIPDFQFYNDKMNSLITIEDLLSHKSGIGNQGTTEVFFPTNDKLKIAKRLKYLKPEGEIKNSFEYSNISYTLAATVIEQITQKSWDTNIKEKIFNPLEMSNSFFSLEEMKKTNNYSLPYGLYKGNIEKVKYVTFYSIAPAGAIKSTVVDLSNWMITWLNNGTFKDNEILPKNYTKKATRLQNIKGGHYDKDAFLFGDGFGWRLRSNYGHFRVDHGGNTDGFSSCLLMFPFQKIGIVVLSNQDNSLLPYMISDVITRRLLNVARESAYPIQVKDIFKPLPYKSFNKEKIPTHTLDDYCGIYKANGFGTIEVSKKDQKLYAKFPTFEFQLEHTHYNWFFLKPNKDFKEVFSPQFDVKFDSDSEGNINLLKLYSQKEPIDFYKN